ncbi:hypothetical protein HOLleu_36797 [Holothuria leucospilota]|uniref:Uncharacterized protein n=1 Tax=Holothuria leucospilota TaxID=206669 RepID=A0A9Q0YMP3_HOLLE|nr:hypothetical protein HOLleu_36797 [Holothuria leucospilota]
MEPQLTKDQPPIQVFNRNNSPVCFLLYEPRQNTTRQRGVENPRGLKAIDRDLFSWISVQIGSDNYTIGLLIALRVSNSGSPMGGNKPFVLARQLRSAHSGGDEFHRRPDN